MLLSAWGSICSGSISLSVTSEFLRCPWPFGTSPAPVSQPSPWLLPWGPHSVSVTFAAVMGSRQLLSRCRHRGWLVGISNSKGNEAPCVLQASFSPYTRDFRCFCSCAQVTASVAVAVTSGGSCVFRASPSSAPCLANDTSDITSVTFRNDKYRAVLQNNRTPMKSQEIFKEKWRVWALLRATWEQECRALVFFCAPP